MTSLKDFADILSQIRGGKRFLARYSVLNNVEFVEALYDELDSIIVEIERNRQARQDDSEDRLTLEIVTCLNQLGYLAEHNAQSGGNVDITVSHYLEDFRWLGEAKWFNNVGDMREGMLQLVTRYAIGSPSQDQGGLVGYLKRPNASKCMGDWNKELQTMGLKELQLDDCQRRPQIAFYSRHLHETSGLPYRVRHVCVMLHHDPQDKSGRRSKGTPL